MSDNSKMQKNESYDEDTCSEKSSDNLHHVESSLSKKKSSSKLSKIAVHRMKKRDAFKRIDCKLIENDIRIKKLEKEIDNVLAKFSKSWETVF